MIEYLFFHKINVKLVITNIFKCNNFEITFFENKIRYSEMPSMKNKFRITTYMFGMCNYL